MMKYLLMLVLLSAASATHAEWFEHIGVTDDPSPRVFRAQGLTATVRVSPQDEDYETLAVSVRHAGFEPASLVVEDLLKGYDKSLGIGKLGIHDPAPSLILQTYLGGNHCCWILDALVPVAGRFQTIHIGGWDGRRLTEFPRDLDGDGNADFVMHDDAFLYAFASYAFSFAPPQIISIEHGQALDVSARPGFRPLFEAYSGRTKAECAVNQNDAQRNGACAAYAASEARLGRLAAALEFVDAAAYQGADATLPSGCKVKYEGACPEDQQVTYENFSSAIRWFLQQNGYVR